MARYELVEGKSSKFWEITLDGASVTTRWGRIGTEGQSKTKSFSSASEAKKEHDKLVAEKTKKGYELLGGASPKKKPGRDPVLDALNRVALAKSRVVESLEDAGEDVPDWLGFEGASEAELAKLEKRLATPLPPSYRRFLALSNGWRHPSPFVDLLFPAREVRWLADGAKEIIDVFCQDDGEEDMSEEEHAATTEDMDPPVFRRAYLKTALQISVQDPGGNGVYLLNPKTRTTGGEWEAWHLAAFLPGVRRYTSFQHLLEHGLDSWKTIED